PVADIYILPDHLRDGIHHNRIVKHRVYVHGIRAAARVEVVHKFIRRGACHFIEEADVYIGLIGISIRIEEFYAHACGGEGGLNGLVEYVVEGGGIIRIKIFARTIKRASPRQPKTYDKRSKEHTLSL